MSTTLTATKSITASCKVAGTLIIPNDYTMQGDFSVSGNLADYEFKSAEKLYARASQYDKVERNGKVIKGSAYTLKMAQNDFNKFAK